MTADPTSIESTPTPLPKRAKTSDAPGADAAAGLPFHPTLLTPDNIKRLADEHANSKPYKWVRKLWVLAEVWIGGG